MIKFNMMRKWPKNICAERHEVTQNWVLWYLTDEQAILCNEVLSGHVMEKLARYKAPWRVTEAGGKIIRIHPALPVQVSEDGGKTWRDSE